ncbi:hypothetical protein [Vibrio alginolyticus]|uniref:hypothetical protein n=1 Tax=Vibrio alginolyticus TaxID=663 RepID=UPI0006CA95F5|nr:hypothetical protein [Vibrio alginolyticus]KPM98337.1 hypothetical protein AOG25_07780 [Vibrio alginolyticus]
MTDKLTFAEYKEEYTLEPNRDLFCYEKLDMNEKGFLKFVESHSLLYARKFEGLKVDLWTFTAKRWGTIEDLYKRHVMKQSISTLYPSEGWLEGVSEGDGWIYALLPETYNIHKQFRVSWYTHSGPINHESFGTREEALLFLAEHKVIVKEGALDNLVGTEVWDRTLTTILAIYDNDVRF